MKKKLEANSPEFRDLVGKLTNTKLNLPPLLNVPKIPISPPIGKTNTSSSSSKTVPKAVESKRDFTFTGVKDVDLLILMKLDDKDLVKTCGTNKYLNNLCKTESFWRIRAQKKLGITEKPADKTWRNYYVELTEEEKGINLYWTTRGQKARYNMFRDTPEFYLSKKSSRWTKNDRLILTNVKNLGNGKFVFGMYEVKTNNLATPLFVNESDLNRYRNQHFKGRTDLMTFKIEKPRYYTEWVDFATGETGPIGTEPHSLPKIK